MKFYKYKAMDQVGKILHGRIEAMNPIDLEMRLSRRDLDMVNHREVKLARGKGMGRGIKRRDLILVCFHLEQTMRAGVPLLTGMQDLRDSVENKRLASVLATMMESVEGGKTLSQAMQGFPAVFDQIFVSLIRAGEISGEMSKVLEELGQTLKWQDEQISQTKKLFIYPSIVGSVVFAVVLFLMIYLVPELLKVVKTMGQELPFHTRVLVAISDLCVNYWYIILASPVVAWLGISFGIRSSTLFHLKCDELKLKIPIVGPILKKIILSRIAGFFSLMYTSGITIIECIDVSEGIAGNKVVTSAMRGVKQQISEGTTLSNSFKSTDLFPPLVLRMVQVGESSGTLGASLQNINYFYTRDVKESIEQLQSMIEPIMTIILGGIVLWVMFSVLGPIYDLIADIKI